MRSPPAISLKESLRSTTLHTHNFLYKMFHLFPHNLPNAFYTPQIAPSTTPHPLRPPTPTQIRP